MSLVLHLLIIISLSYFFVYLVIKYAPKLNLYDMPNERSHHCSITPSGAGIGFVGALCLSFIILDFGLFVKYWYIFTSILMVFAMGVYDDRHEIPARVKFLAIFAAVFLLWLNGFSIDTFGRWYGYDLTLPPYLALVWSLFAISGYTNALNLIDGIDGLSSSISLVILLFFAFIGFEYHSDIIVLLSTFTMASISGFLVFNWYPARIFMGDSGSLSLGFIISVLAVLSLQYAHPVALLYIVALPVLDTCIVMVRRISHKKSPFSPDKTHIHHIMVQFFDMNVPKTVVFLVILQIIFSAIGYMILDSLNRNGGNNIPLFAGLGFLFMFILFYMIFTGMYKHQKGLDFS